MSRSQTAARRQWQRTLQRRRAAVQTSVLPAPEAKAWQLRDTLMAACAAAGIALALCSTGCNRFLLYQHRHTACDFTGEPHVTYYHYPAGSWFIPAQQTNKHCPEFVEPPFHGYASTCWNRWPEPWEPCPPPGMCGPRLGEEIITPPGEMLEQPQAQPALEPSPAAPAYESSRRPGAMPKASAEMHKLAAPKQETITVEPAGLLGAHGFSEPNDDQPSSAVVVDLTPAQPKRSGFSD